MYITISYQGPRRQFEVGGAWDFFQRVTGRDFLKITVFKSGNRIFNKSTYFKLSKGLNMQCNYWTFQYMLHFERANHFFFSFHDDLGSKLLHVWYVTSKGIANVPANISSTKMLGGLQPPSPPTNEAPEAIIYSSKTLKYW